AQGRPHAVARVRVDLLAEDDLAAVGLVDVDVQRGRDDDGVQERLEPLGDEGLQRVGDDGQLDAGQAGGVRAPAGGGVDDGAAGDGAAGRLHALDAAVRAADAGDLGEGVDLDAEAVGAAGVAPDDGVVADDAAGRVVEAGADGLVRPVADVEA